MSKRPNIKWRKSDAEKLDAAIKSFNKKIYNTRHRNPVLKDILPNTIKQSDKARMIEELKSLPRNEFNKQIKSLERVLEPDAFKPITSKTGNRVTNWEKREIGYKVAQINRDRTRERKIIENMDATSRGEPLGMKRGEMGSERMNALKPKQFNFDKIRGGKEWEKFKASIDKLASPTARNQRMEEYKANYLKGLQNAFGDYANDVIKIIEGLPADVVVETFYSEQEATIDFFYEPQEMELKLDMLNDIWAGVEENYNEVSS